MSTERHDAWVDEIKAQLGRYEKLRRQVRFFPLFAFATAPVGLVWAPWVAVSMFLAWMSLWATTLYITHMKGWQYRQELAQLRLERHP